MFRDGAASDMDIIQVLRAKEKDIKKKKIFDRKYKLRVQHETIGNDYRKFIKNKKECNMVIFQNLIKALFLSTDKIFNVQDILLNVNLIKLNLVLKKQLDYLEAKGYIYVLCTCVFYIVEYNPKLLN